jgi:chromosome segregation and condensation protein ScpB
MERGEGGLANAEIRRITHLDRGQVKRLMSELRQEKQASSVGLGRSSKWVYDE